MPSQENNLLFAHARARDWVWAIMKDKDKIRIPSSTIQPDRVNTRNSRRKWNQPGKYLHEWLCTFLCWVSCMLPISIVHSICLLDPCH
jgi:hypothetical protein